MKNKIVYYALGAVALYYLYDWYKKKMPMQTPVAPGKELEVLQSETYSLMPSSPVNASAPGLTIVSDFITPTLNEKVKEIPTYQTFYGQSLNGLKVGQVPMTC
jgi:hypothetical protein